ncbi:MAG: hypothetical protein MJ252_14875, partial [archaeon]|nr:hypothetical protein [archaeon]
MERVYYGIGCSKMKSVKSHVNKYHEMFRLKDMMIAIVCVGLMSFILMCVKQILKVHGSLILYPFVYYFFVIMQFIFLGLGLGLQLAYLSFDCIHLKYFKKFRAECQVNYSNIVEGEGINTSNRNMDSYIEMQFRKDLSFCLYFSIINSVVFFITLVAYIIDFALICDKHKMAYGIIDEDEEQTLKRGIYKKDVKILNRINKVNIDE